MIDRTELDDYFMKPYDLKGVGLIYPVELFNYQRFKYLASKYLIQGNQTLFNLYKVPKDTNLLDYFVGKGYENHDMNNKVNEEIQRIEVNDLKPANEKEENYIKSLYAMRDNYTNNKDKMYLIEELKELFSIVFQSDIKFNYINKDNYNFEIISNHNYINRYNFYDIREVVMWENLLNEPPTSPNKFGNQAIERAIKQEFGDVETSLASICSVVSCNSGVSDNELMQYTYYRLRYDFEIVNRQHGNLFSFMLRSQGNSQAEISNLSEIIDLHKNPYDCLFRKFDNNKGKM